MTTTTINDLSSVTNIKVLDCLLALNLQVSIWSARKKLTPEDFSGVSGLDLPPDDLASLGSKRVCDPDSLRIFSTLKYRAVSLLDRHGVRFLGGWAIPEAEATNIVRELQQLQHEFLTEKDVFLARYDDAVQDWIAKHTGWETIISNSTVSADYVRSHLSFAWQVYKVVNPQEMRHLAPVVTEGLEQAVSGLGMTLFGEIAKAANDAWKRTYAGRTSISQKALSPLKTMQAKLRGMSFVEPRVIPIVDVIRTALDNVPSQGEITGRDLLMLQGVVGLLRDPESLVSHGQKVLDGQTPAEVLQALFVAPDTISADSSEDDASIPAPLPPQPDLSELIQAPVADPAQPLNPVPGPVPPVPDFPVPHPAPSVDSLGLW